MSTFTFKVTVELKRESGKSVPNDEIEEQIQDALESADLGEIEGGPDGDSIMTVTNWEVTQI